MLKLTMFLSHLLTKEVGSLNLAEVIGHSEADEPGRGL